MGFKEINADKAAKISADTFRINFRTSENGDSLQIDFGEFVGPKTEERTVDVKAYVVLPVEAALEMVTTLFTAAIDYQKETGKNIGFPDKVAKEGEQ